jgi:hypothetical protein
MTGRDKREDTAVWEYRTDTTKNRLYVAVSRGLSASEAPSVIRGVVQAMNLLKPGFSIIGDLSDLPENDTQGSQLLSAMEEAAQRFGVSRVIYVRPLINSGPHPKSWPCVSFQGSEARSIDEARRMLGDRGDTL